MTAHAQIARDKNHHLCEVKSASFSEDIALYKIKKFTFIALSLTIFSLLAACTSYSIEGSVISQENSACSATQYFDLVDRNAPSLNSGRDRDQIVRTLSEMAEQIWQNQPPTQQTCHVQYALDYSSHARPIYGVEIESPVTVMVLAERRRVCLNHTDLDGPDRYGVRVADEDITYPWRWIDQGPSIDGLSEGFFARREYVPVCFDQSGNITEYLNG